jgi:hypothetical protein
MRISECAVGQFVQIIEPVGFVITSRHDFRGVFKGRGIADDEHRGLLFTI